MRAWKRILFDMACGNCKTRFARGTPMLTYAGIGWQKWRCETCVGEQAPAELPPLQDATRAEIVERVAAIRRPSQFDPKVLQLPERER